MRERDAGGPPPRTDRVEDDTPTDDDEIPPEAMEEARRWKDVPTEEPEESTGIDV